MISFSISHIMCEFVFFFLMPSSCSPCIFFIPAFQPFEQNVWVTIFPYLIVKTFNTINFLWS